MPVSRLPIPVPPAQHETVSSYLSRLASVHGLHPRELWASVSSSQPGTSRRVIHADRLADLTGRPATHLVAALPDLDPMADWTAWRHQPQPRCPRCDARHDGGPVQRLLPHHDYVCLRHSYWIGPPDVGQPATELGRELRKVVRAQHRHLRLQRRHGADAAFDAVLTGFLICGHLWDNRSDEWGEARRRWELRTQRLVPRGREETRFSASRIFAAVYPEAVDIAELIAAPTWRRTAFGDLEHRQRFTDEISRRLGDASYRPRESDDPIAHWMKYDSPQPPSRPRKTYRETRDYGAMRPASTTNAQSRDRQSRSAMWFARKRCGGTVILHHRHVQPVLIRAWSPAMDGISAAIWASGSTLLPAEHRRSEVDMIVRENGLLRQGLTGVALEA